MPFHNHLIRLAAEFKSLDLVFMSPKHLAEFAAAV